MGWIYRSNYVGPDRRTEKFQVRFVERRREESAGTRASFLSAAGAIGARALRWVNHLNYFGPDRRADTFSFFFRERRRNDSRGAPPPLDTALRQLRLRVIEAQTPEGRAHLRERLLASALLADARGRKDIGDALHEMAGALDRPGGEAEDLGLWLRAELNRTEAMLDGEARFARRGFADGL